MMASAQHQQSGSKTLEQRCAAHSLQMNEKRRMILRILEDVEGHPDALDIFKQARLVDPKVNIATVYRALRLLTEAGLLARRTFGDGKVRYESAEEAQHNHLIDQDGGQIIEFQSPHITEIVSQIATAHGYRLVDYKLELFGRKESSGKEST